MRQPGKLGLALGLVVGGIALGSLLGAAADPEMKNLPERSWNPAPAGADGDYPPAGFPSYEIASYPDRYPPPLADEAVTDWAPDYPAWSYSDFGDTPAEPLADGRAAATEAPPAESEVLPREPRLPGNLAALY